MLFLRNRLTETPEQLALALKRVREQESPKLRKGEIQFLPGSGVTRNGSSVSRIYRYRFFDTTSREIFNSLMLS